MPHGTSPGAPRISTGCALRGYFRRLGKFGNLTPDRASKAAAWRRLVELREDLAAQRLGDDRIVSEMLDLSAKVLSRWHEFCARISFGVPELLQSRHGIF